MNITILQTSDIHGNIFPVNYGTNTYAESGLAKVSTLVDLERRKEEHVLLIDNGDLIQGTPLTYHYARSDGKEIGPHPMTAALNEIGYDASVFGNHEFNYGLQVLEDVVQESRHPWISANILDAETGEPRFGDAYLLKEIPGGPTIAVIGLTTPYIPYWENPEHIKGIIFADPVETARKWVPYLKREKEADILIVSYHGGFERDLDTGKPIEKITRENQGWRLCHEVDGIDVLLTGHQHRQIAVKNVNGVTVLQPGSAGAVLGRICLQAIKRETGWKIEERHAELLSVEGVEADSRLMKQLQPYEAAAQEWLDTPMGEIRGDMVVQDAMQIRMKDNPLIEFINRVQMDAANVDISTTALFDNRSPGFPEHVTMRDIVSNYIYPNTLKVLQLTGKDIRDALERSASYFRIENGEVTVNPSFTTPKPQHYNYDMWEGIEYILNISRPEGERVVKLAYKGEAVRPEQVFQVAMNNYRAGGGGQYFMYQDKPVLKEIQIDISELIANYFLKHQVVNAEVNHNWEVVTD